MSYVFNLSYSYFRSIDGLGQLVFTGEGYSCNDITRVTTHPCSEHEYISPNVFADGKCGMVGGVVFCALVSEV